MSAFPGESKVLIHTEDTSSHSVERKRPPIFRWVSEARASFINPQCADPETIEQQQQKLLGVLYELMANPDQPNEMAVEIPSTRLGQLNLISRELAKEISRKAARAKRKGEKAETVKIRLERTERRVIIAAEYLQKEAPNAQGFRQNDRRVDRLEIWQALEDPKRFDCGLTREILDRELALAGSTWVEKTEPNIMPMSNVAEPNARRLNRLLALTVEAMAVGVKRSGLNTQMIPTANPNR